MDLGGIGGGEVVEEWHPRRWDRRHDIVPVLDGDLGAEAPVVEEEPRLGQPRDGAWDANRRQRVRVSSSRRRETGNRTLRDRKLYSRHSARTAIASAITGVRCSASRLLSVPRATATLPPSRSMSDHQGWRIASIRCPVSCVSTSATRKRHRDLPVPSKLDSYKVIR